jgi:hypothetical protein
MTYFFKYNTFGFDSLEKSNKFQCNILIQRYSFSIPFINSRYTALSIQFELSILNVIIIYFKISMFVLLIKKKKKKRYNMRI